MWTSHVMGWYAVLIQLLCILPDIDECGAGDHGCHVDGVCFNLDGSYECTCKAGYIGDGLNCTDIDECSTIDHGCHANSICSNVDESYKCTCKAGYGGDGINCTDIDECATSSHDCHVNGDCSNTVGSYDCTCKAGYSGDGLICEDIDECAINGHDCHVNGICSNTVGSYDCTCNARYEGNGLICCEEHWIRHNNYCYFFAHTERNFKEARTHCWGLGADLASIHSQDEQDFINNNVKREAFWESPANWWGIGYWIGFNDRDIERHFVWTDGTEVTYTDWLPNQPNGDNGQNCVSLGWEPTNGLVWHDYKCSKTYAYICKKS